MGTMNENRSLVLLSAAAKPTTHGCRLRSDPNVLKIWWLKMVTPPSSFSDFLEAVA